MTGDPDLDDEFGDDEPSPQPWHNSTPAVVGASAIGLAVIAILVAAVNFMTGQAEPPTDAPFNFVEPSFSATTSRTPTTTATITSTTKVSTTEINAPLAPLAPPTSSTSSSSESSSPPSQEEDEDEDEPTTRTPRRTPRTNVTRTLLPQPIG